MQVAKGKAIGSYISGLQQVGIGVPDAEAAFQWYKKTFGLGIRLFDDVAQATLMTPHTNGQVRTRRAILALNLAGGGGAEIWQSLTPEPLPPAQPVQLGDLGIFACKIKAPNVAAFAESQQLSLQKQPNGTNSCWLKDPWGNAIQVVENTTWFRPKNEVHGGICGVVIGVSSIQKALPLYRDTLGFSEVVYESESQFKDLELLPNGKGTFKRILLRKPQSSEGAFANLLGNIEIELLQSTDYQPNTIYKNRSWGDLGYIHVCFDITDMDAHKAVCQASQFPFTVDSADSFDMGEAAGRFSYLMDPDGTLIEFVETHKVPVLKKFGWYINLKKRRQNKPLPNWMVAAMGWGKK